MLTDIARNNFTGMGKPEPLKNNLSGYLSRRIDEVNRLLYKVVNDQLVGISFNTSSFFPTHVFKL